MCELRCDLDKNDEVFVAIQTILNAFSDLKKSLGAVTVERDSLAEKLKSMQSVLSTPNESFRTPNYESRRKRLKTATPPDAPIFDTFKSPTSLQDVTNDELNAAFHSSPCDDDEVIAGTQIEITRKNLQKSVKYTHDRDRSANNSRSPPNEGNKENSREEVSRLTHKKSIENAKQTIFSKQPIKKEADLSDTAETPEKLFGTFNDSNDSADCAAVIHPSSSSVSGCSRESPKWKSKAVMLKKSTPRRLFDNWSCPSVKQSPSSPKQKPASTKKKISLSLPKSSRLKQSTISFPKVSINTQHESIAINNNETSVTLNEDETYCEGISIRLDCEDKYNVNNILVGPPKLADFENVRTKTERTSDGYKKSPTEVKIERHSSAPSAAPVNKETRKNVSVFKEATENSNDASVFALPTETDEIIIVEESEPSQELFRNVIEGKTGGHKNTVDVLEESEAIEAPIGKSKAAPSTSSTSKDDQPKVPGMGCEDCENYHRMIGRDLNSKNLPKKYGVCSKHRSNIQRPDTPPGFWNPKIPDTPEDEHIETPFDYRFVKNKF